MKCPHCRENFHEITERINIGIDAEGGWILLKRDCPSCNKMILHIANGEPIMGASQRLYDITGDIKTILVRPKGSSRPPCPVEVPTIFAEDYIGHALFFQIVLKPQPP